MAKRVRKTKKMSEAIKPTIKKAPKKATPTKKKTTVTKSSVKKQEPKKATPTKKTTTKKTTTSRKKTTTKKVTNSTARKRTTKKPVVNKAAGSVVKKVDNLKVVEKPKATKRPVNDNRYIRVSEKSKTSKFVEMGEKVQRGEVRWVYYAIDGNIGYHYYLKLKKKK